MLRLFFEGNPTGQTGGSPTVRLHNGTGYHNQNGQSFPGGTEYDLSFDDYPYTPDLWDVTFPERLVFSDGGVWAGVFTGPL